MKSSRLLIPVLLGALFFGACKSSTPVGTMTIAGTSFTVTEENGNAAPGTTTRFVIKPTGGRGTITTVTAWIGLEDPTGSTVATGVYDPTDGDFDTDVMAPATRAPGSQLWVSVLNGDVATTAAFNLP